MRVGFLKVGCGFSFSVIGKVFDFICLLGFLKFEWMVYFRFENRFGLEEVSFIVIIIINCYFLIIRIFIFLKYL